MADRDPLPRLSDLELVSRGDGDYDVIAGPLIVELSRDPDGAWTFWNVRLDDDRFGGTQHVSPGAFNRWLDERAGEL